MAKLLTHNHHACGCENGYEYPSRVHHVFGSFFLSLHHFHPRMFFPDIYDHEYDNDLAQDYDENHDHVFCWISLHPHDYLDFKGAQLRK